MKTFYLTIAFITLSMINYAQTIVQWQNCIGGSGYDRAGKIEMTSDSGFVLAGATNSTDGDITGSYGNNDFLLVRLSKNGDLIWQKNYGGSGDEGVSDVKQTSDGGFIMAGTTDSNDGNISNNYGLKDAWVVKVDSTGNMQWEKNFGGSNHDYFYSICPTFDKGYIAIGETYSDDVDVISNNFSYPYHSVFLVKLDSLGNKEWSKIIGYTGYERATSIIQTNDGGFAFTGNKIKYVPPYNLPESDIWIVKLDANGNIEWQNTKTTPSWDAGKRIIQTNNDDFIITGGINSRAWLLKFDQNGQYLKGVELDDSIYTYSHSVKQTIDGGFAVITTCSSNSECQQKDFRLFKLNHNFETEWFTTAGGSDLDFAGDFCISHDNGFVIVGVTHSFDGDVLGYHGDGDIWVVKLLTPNVEGMVFHDENLNGVLDLGELPVAGQLLRMDPSLDYSYSNNHGKFYFYAGQGNNSVTLIPGQYWYSTGASTCNFNISTSNTIIDTLIFGVASNKPLNDIAVYLISGPARAGFDMTFYLFCKNHGTTNLSGNLVLTYDSLLTYQTSSIPYVQHNGNEITWNYDPLGPGIFQIIEADFQVPNFSFIGDTLQTHVFIEPLISDSDIQNNYDTLWIEITSSFDPNDKTVFPAGVGNEKNILPNQRLKYLIRFQNTGNDTAFTVLIKDPLDKQLNIETLSIDAYSHPVKWELFAGNELRFIFENILLPDSNTNEPKSHGFILFSISPKPGLPDNTKICNSSYIYFDFNPPVETNTVCNKIKYFSPSNHPGLLADNIAWAFPNPVQSELNIISKNENNKSISIYDAFGRLVFYMSTKQKTLTIDVSLYHKGVYFINIVSDQGKFTQKLIKL